jgi:hypothetical protein
MYYYFIHRHHEPCIHWFSSFHFSLLCSPDAAIACSFDSIRLGNCLSQNHCGNGNGVTTANHGCGMAAAMDGGVMPCSTAPVAAAGGRRGSFLYRSSESSSDLSPMSLSRKLSTVDT